MQEANWEKNGGKNSGKSVLKCHTFGAYLDL